MGIVFRQSIKTLLVTVTGALLGAAAIYLSTQLIAKQELGFSRTITSAAAIAGQILVVGFQSVLSVFIYRYPPGDRRRAVLLTFCFAVPIVATLLVSGVYFLFKARIVASFQLEDQPFIFNYFAWLPLFSLLFTLQLLLEQYLSSQMKLALAVFMREIALRLVNVGLILLFGFQLIDYDTFIAGTVLAYLVPVLLLFYFARNRTKGFEFSFHPKELNGVEYREILHFAWFHSLLVAALALLNALDGLMLPVLAPEGLRSVAVYTVAAYILSLIQIPYKAMLNASYPIIAQAFKDEDMPRVKDLYTRSSENILIASLGAALLIACNLENGIAIMPKGYEALKPLVLILLVGRLVDMSTGMNDQLLSISKHYRFGFYLSAGLLALAVLLYWKLIPLYGVFGAAWGTSIALILYNVIKVLFIWKRLGLLPLKPHSLFTLLAAAAAGLAGYFLPYVYNTFVDAALRSLVIVVVYASLLLWLKPSDDLIQYLSNVRKSKRLF